jgi:hypothetical protein
MRETTNYQFTKTISQIRFWTLTYLFTQSAPSWKLETLMHAVCCSLAQVRRLFVCSAAGPRYCCSVVVRCMLLVRCTPAPRNPHAISEVFQSNQPTTQHKSRNPHAVSKFALNYQFVTSCNRFKRLFHFTCTPQRSCRVNAIFSMYPRSNLAGLFKTLIVKPVTAAATL